MSQRTFLIRIEVLDVFIRELGEVGSGPRSIPSLSQSMGLFSVGSVVFQFYWQLHAFSEKPGLYIGALVFAHET